MSVTLKRNLVSCPTGDASKRRCMVASNTNRVCAYKNNNGTSARRYSVDATTSSSSDNDSDHDDDRVSFDTHRANYLSMKSNRFGNLVDAAPIDSKLSKAVSQYSDDDEDENAREVDTNGYTSTAGSFKNTNNKINREKDGGKLLFSSGTSRMKKRSGNDILKVNYVADQTGLENQTYHDNSAKAIGFSNYNIPNAVLNNKKVINYNISNKLLKHSGNIPSGDFAARSRCFEYLVSAIDEAWASYCDSTSYDEDVAYGYSNAATINSNDGADVNYKRNNSMDYESNVSSNQIANTPNSNVYTSDEDDGYKTEFSTITTVTEYDSDFNNHNQHKLRSFSINNNLNNTPCNRRVSEVPENLRLQQLKVRFTKFKYYLEDLVDSDVYSDCLAFWSKWDLIKYSIVDFVEEDEEDDDVERRIDELEAGRFAGSLSN